MNWTNLLWLGVGFGLGLVTYRQGASRRKSPAPVPQFSEPKFPPPLAAESPDLAPPPDTPDLHDRLKQLELAYQMATEMSHFKGGFLARTSHELRSPLNGLIGTQQILLSGLCDSPEEEREFITQANISAQRMIAMLDDILTVARVDHGKIKLDMQPVQLANIFQDVYALTHLQAQDCNLRLTIQPPDPELYILTDPLRLRQVLVHLVDAAIRQLPEGAITVSAQPDPRSNYVQIWVDDHRSASDRAEPLDLLSSEIPSDSTIPSPGLTLLADQILLGCMQGRLEVVPSSSPSSASPDSTAPTRIQCSVPLVVPESE